MAKNPALPPTEPHATEEEMIASAVERTGFPLEHRTATAFSDAGWSIVSNKYYVDDAGGEVREIDIIAYKIHRLDEYNIYSAVVVSCKRTTDNRWVFLTRAAKPANPNVNSTPFHFWTNDPALRYSLTRDGFSKSFSQGLSKESPSLWGIPEREVFGFQELAPVRQDKKGRTSEMTHFKPDNDRALFSSIQSLMKAQAYELGRLPSRSKQPVVYIFSLLSVMDGDMFEMLYDHESAGVTNTKLVKYIAHYIIKGEEQFSRINFVHKDLLPDVLVELDKAHDNARAEIVQARDRFFSSVIHNHTKKALLIPTFARKIVTWLNIYGNFRGSDAIDEGSIDLLFNAKKAVLEVQLATTASEESVLKLNDSEKLREKTREALKEVFKYEGAFAYAEDDIPF